VPVSSPLPARIGQQAHSVAPAKSAPTGEEGNEIAHLQDFIAALKPITQDASAAGFANTSACWPT
jgi:hypothetical protein